MMMMMMEMKMRMTPPTPKGMTIDLWRNKETHRRYGGARPPGCIFGENMANACPSQAPFSTKEAGLRGIFAQHVLLGSMGKEGKNIVNASKPRSVGK